MNLRRSRRLPRLHGRLRAALGAAAVLALVGCAWSMPADPGMNARIRPGADPYETAPSGGGSPAGASPTAVRSAMTDDGARAVYAYRCSQCHEPFSPRHASPAEWPSIVRKYGPRAGLFGSERERVLTWLQANAR